MKKAEDEGHLLTKEAQRAASYLCLDFEKGGIHLSSEKLERVNQLNTEISQLCQEFGQNMAVDMGSVDVFPATCIPKHLHRICKPIYRSTSGMSMGSTKSTSNMQEKGSRIITDPASLSSVLQWVADEEVRKMAYIEGNSVPVANLGVLDKLIAARHELAQITGYASYAEFALKQNMASSPDVVMSFLLEMSEMVRDKADKEFNAIQNFKRQKSGQCVDLEPWDEAYYTAMMKSSMYDLDSSVVASYFPLPRCIEGLKILVQSLFGATFHSVPLAPGESWHSDVLKMALHHPEEGDLGYLYLDLYARKGKYPGCAHFAIKGGRWISSTEYRLPVLYISMHFEALTFIKSDLL